MYIILHLPFCRSSATSTSILWFKSLHRWGVQRSKFCRFRQFCWCSFWRWWYLRAILTTSSSFCEHNNWYSWNIPARWWTNQVDNLFRYYKRLMLDNHIIWLARQKSKINISKHFRLEPRCQDLTLPKYREESTSAKESDGQMVVFVSSRKPKLIKLSKILFLNAHTEILKSAITPILHNSNQLKKR